MSYNTCGKCGLSHSALGIRIEGGTLSRSVDKSRHLFHKGGDAWAFETALFDCHPEVDYIICREKNTSEVWQVHRATFDRMKHNVYASGKQQYALRLAFWSVERQAEPDSEAVQPLLIPSSEFRGTRFEPAKKPRPRAEPKRRRWWG